MFSALDLIGNTPIYKIPNKNIYVKLEKFNLAGSIKDRPVLDMILNAKKNGILNQNSVIVEASSGNTGISIAVLSNIFCYKSIIIMPENMSDERKQLIRAFGSSLILTDSSLGIKGSIEKAKQLLTQNQNYISLNQFDNPINSQSHYYSTGVEILNQIPNIDIFITGIGTGGSFTGISKRLKQHNPNIKCIAVEPLSCSVISGCCSPSPHKIQGIGPGFIPSILDTSLIDSVITVSDQQAISQTVDFVKNTGILVGISTGANIFASNIISKKYPSKNIVTLSPDGGEKYLSQLSF